MLKERLKDGHISKVEIMREKFNVELRLYFLNFYFFLTERERDRDRAWVGEGQRKRETQNLKQAPGSKLSAQSPTRGSNSGWNSRTTRS